MQETKKDKFFKTCGNQSVEECSANSIKTHERRIKIAAALVQGNGAMINELCKEPLTSKTVSLDEDLAWIREKVITKVQ